VTVLVTGSSGHLGEALLRTLQAQRRAAIGIDVLPGAFTHQIGSITDRAFVRRCMQGVTTVLHAATLHKPHVATHSRQDFVDVNISGTLNLLEEAAAAGITAFVYTSTTSVFGDALVPPPGEPAAWITEDVTAVPKNIYGVTKAAAEDLCQLFARNHSLHAIVLRTSRFFPEADDNPAIREAYTDANIKTNELLYRRVDIEDVVSAHLLAADHAPSAGFAKYIISATTPFSCHDFRALIARLRAGEDIRSPLAREVGSKGYHDRAFREGPYPVA
jgi:UDP-glucose 4-epimerase